MIGDGTWVARAHESPSLFFAVFLPTFVDVAFIQSKVSIFIFFAWEPRIGTVGEVLCG